MIVVLRSKKQADKAEADSCWDNELETLTLLLIFYGQRFKWQ